MKKKYIVWLLLAAALLLGLWTAWNLWFAPTKIAFLNYQVIELEQIARANNNPYIRLCEVDLDKPRQLKRCNMLFINGMGLHITEDQRNLITQAARKGLPVLTTLATNPDNNIRNIDSLSARKLSEYIVNGGRQNYRSMLNFVRKKLYHKLIYDYSPENLKPRSHNLLYHPPLLTCGEGDADDDNFDDLGFDNVNDYHKFLNDNGLYAETAPRIIVTGMMGEPTELIRRLEKTGNQVYPVRNLTALIRSHRVDTVQPAAIINLAHGRLGDYVVNYLSANNIPLFSPLNINRLVSDWEADKMGMSGGFLSQSVVMPEIDGAIRSYAVFGNYRDKNGMQRAFAIPERLDVFVQTVNNYIRLKTLDNSKKRVAIYYYKGPGQSQLSAAGMEVVPSLFNLLNALKSNGYLVNNLPSTPKQLQELIQREGALYATYAEGAAANFMQNAHPVTVGKQQYDQWIAKSIRPDIYAEVVALHGDFPGQHMVNDQNCLCVPRIDFGNVVLLPQPLAGTGGDAFKIVHGTDAAPPHTYIASYLWVQHQFKADAMIHFGTHGSLEFTPRKQVALCHNDWPDRLVGALPHFYVYTIGNVGEGMIAKRRAYAGLQSYLTPPFLESNVRGIYKQLEQAITLYYNQLDKGDSPQIDKCARRVKTLAVKMGINRELGIDSLTNVPLSEDDVMRVENFAEELATEKITGQLYTMGVPYSSQQISSSVKAMAADPIAYSLQTLDKLRNKLTSKQLKSKRFFTQHYLNPAKLLVDRLLQNPSLANDQMLCSLASITRDELLHARQIDSLTNTPPDFMAVMKGHQRPEKEALSQISRDEIQKTQAVLELERTLHNVGAYRRALYQSPQIELASLLNALNGGYTRPSPGGDPIANPNTLPTGRNLFAINAEATPTVEAWNKGVQLAKNTIEMYRKRHNDSIPRKVSYTLWSGEFVETQGATIAQVLYMLGVEPIRDAFGRVQDLRLIPANQLGRPRIDVVVQTSGQLRDLAASRLFLINRAVEMAAADNNTNCINHVASGVIQAEKLLIDKGMSPKMAREVSTYRVFGAQNGNYGTGIQSMVLSGSRWDSTAQIANVYLNNMGAFYGNQNNWEIWQKHAFEAALLQTDAVIQPRQSNTWGALSLDHVYEFMGGLNLSVNYVTGKEPDAYMSDYRNRNHVRMQEVKEAIGVESRTTLFNPTFIREKMKGGASAAATFAELVQNTYGWNVMKPMAIDNQMWNEIFNVYVDDRFKLNIQQFFEDCNPAALQQITAVMMESARKNMWHASPAQLSRVAKLHTDLIAKYKPACTGFVCDNPKLQKFIANQIESDAADDYQQSIKQMREVKIESNAQSVVMKKEQVHNDNAQHVNSANNALVWALASAMLLALVILIAKRRKK